ncbi:MAG TPA: type II CAAX endopeptidase family protein [Candidatus Angelobacter sp.]|nr:type II CAAX endopeptidase family protein [Candidatus Angelobacter sp.]
MQNESQPNPGSDPVTEQPYDSPPSLQTPEEPPQGKKLLAPIWHTLLIVILVVGNSYFTAKLSSQKSQNAGAITENMRLVQYGATIVLEFFLLFVVWIGLRMKKARIRDLIGGRWASPEDFLIDVVIAIAFWLVALAVLGGLGYLLGLAKGASAEEAKKLAEMLAPRSTFGLVLWVLLSTTAGYVEEIIFRGYLQQQFAVLSGNIYVGLVASAIVFGSGHGYEGTRRMILIAVYGAMFGFLTLWRKSLRPGMMAHALHDGFEGVLLHFIAQKGLPSMH